MKSIPAIFLLLWSALAAAQAPANSTAWEIEQLLSVLAHSDCQFYRNGSWYDSAKAGAHLRRKYEYLLDRGLVKSTEAFIDLAASKSSFSGKPYFVKCGNAPSVDSRTWFTRKLQEVRASRASAIDSFKLKPLPGSD